MKKIVFILMLSIGLLPSFQKGVFTLLNVINVSAQFGGEGGTGSTGGTGSFWATSPLMSSWIYTNYVHVGINTNFPRYTLDVNGNLHSSGSLNVDGSTVLTGGISGNLTVNGNVNIPADKSLNFGDLYSTSYGYLGISTSAGCKNTYATYKENVYFKSKAMDVNANTLALLNNGNVLIGGNVTWEKSTYSQADYKLTVRGAILCEKLKIIADVPNYDIVFDHNYKLRSLANVDSFVTTHKHLPDVPSATEFKSNGYSVGEMDGIMLRKVEELTLYSIQLKKENEVQAKSNEFLLQQLSELKQEMGQIKKALAK